MLIRLILFVALFAGAWSAFTWWRRNRHALGAGERGLGVGEFERLRKQAKSHPRLEKAIQLRVNVVAASGDNDRREMSQKVDAALRRIGEQLSLKTRIEEALAGIDRDRLAREAAGAEAQAQSADPEASVHALATQLNLQLEQVDKLSARTKALDEAVDRIVLLLGNLNLALLEAESSRATTDSGKVQTVLASLEEAGDTARRTSEAEAEVDRFLQASQAQAARALGQST